MNLVDRRRVKYYDNRRAKPDQYGWCLHIDGGMNGLSFAVVERPDGKVDHVCIDDDFMFVDLDEFEVNERVAERVRSVNNYGFDTDDAAKEWRNIQVSLRDFNKRFPAPATIHAYSTYCWTLADSCERCFREYGECGIQHRKITKE